MCESCSSTQIVREMVLFSMKIYIAGTNFTRPPVATNLNSVVHYTLCKVVLQSFTYLNLLSLCNIIHALHCVQDAMAEPLTQELHLSVAQLSALGGQASCSSLLVSLAR